MFVKKFLLALLCGVAVLSFGVQSHAAKLRLETFSYPDGSLVAANPPKWLVQSGTPLQMQVVSGEAVVLEDGSLSEDLRMQFALSGTTNIYYGLDFRVDSGAGPFNTDPNAFDDNEYFAHFLVSGTFAFNSRLDVVGPSGGGDFSVGICSDCSVAEATWPTDLSFDTTYRAVVEYDQVDNQAILWIDAVLSSDPSISGVNNGGVGVDIVSGFGLRQSSSDAGETVRVDNITIASTFAEVVDSSSAIPEPASLVLMLAGLAGMLTRRRM